MNAEQAQQLMLTIQQLQQQIKSQAATIASMQQVQSPSPGTTASQHQPLTL